MSKSPQKTCEGCSRHSRRGFLATAMAGALGLVFWPTRVWAKKLALRLDKVPVLKRVGGSLTLRIRGTYVLLIRESETTLRASSAICSHRRSPLTYDSTRQKIVCREHGSLFTLGGKVLKGPATKNIASYGAKLDQARKRILLEI